MSKHEHVWSWPIAGYLFLGGLGAGMAILAAVADIFFGLSFILIPCILGSFVCLGLGSFLLIFELGRPLHFWRVFSKEKAILTFGAWMVIALMVFDVLYFSFWFASIPWSGVQGMRVVISGFCLILGCGVLLYTGIELSSMKARVFWNTPALPIVFALSGLLSGAAANYLIVSVWPYAAWSAVSVPVDVFDIAATAMLARSSLLLTTAILGVATLVGTFIYVIMMYTSSFTGARKAAERWLSGRYALAFWGGFIAIGIGIPLILLFFSLEISSTLAALCIIFGGVVLRFLVVYCDDRRELPGEALYWQRLPEGDETFLKCDW